MGEDLKIPEKAGTKAQIAALAAASEAARPRGFTALKRWTKPAKAGLSALIVTMMLTAFAIGTFAVQRLEHWLGDWRFVLAGERLDDAHPDVALLLIREESLVDKPAYSPIDRALLADLIRQVDSFRPRAIGLDFVFDKATAQDDALIKAISEASAPVALGVYETRGGGDAVMIDAQRKAQEEFLQKAKGPVGFLNLGSDFDGVQRRRPSPYPGDGAPLSFADRLAELAGAPIPARAGGDRIDWLVPPRSGGEAFTSFFADDLATLSAAPALLKNAFEDRVVLIGAGLRPGGMADYHETPLEASTNEEALGAVIVAQMIAQRLDGRELVEFGPALSILAASAAAFFGAWFSLLLGRTALDVTLALTALFCLDLALFAWADVITPLGALLLAWTAGAVIAGGLREDEPRRRRRKRG